MGEMAATTGKGRRSRKPTTKAREGNPLSLTRDTVEGEALSGSDGREPDSGRPAKKPAVPKSLFAESAAKHKMSISMPQRNRGSPSETPKAVTRWSERSF